jgi:hypothetical protein
MNYYKMGFIMDFWNDNTMFIIEKVKNMDENNMS